LQGAFATFLLHPADYWARLDRQSRLLWVSVGASLLLHAFALSVHFRFPDALRWKSANQPLDVILVNARTQEAPAKREALAQVNLDGGGNTDETRRARTPLPVTEPRDPGRDLAEGQRRVQQREPKRQRVLTQAEPAPANAAPDTTQRAESSEPAPRVSGRDLADLALAALKLQAQIDRAHEEYQKRPRKKFLGARATEYRFAQYEEGWRMKIERIGTLNYPSAARGKLYGSLRLTVTIRPDGTVDKMELDRSSGLKVLDEAAYRIVRMAEPFAPFPADIRRDVDLLVITRTWFFERGDTLGTRAD
jgi:protein TonB